jgi:hypothetical protein
LNDVTKRIVLSVGHGSGFVRRNRSRSDTSYAGVTWAWRPSFKPLEVSRRPLTAGSRSSIF